MTKYREILRLQSLGINQTGIAESCGCSRCQKNKLEAIAMDMWDPYIKAVKEKVPHVKIVFDQFHVVNQFSRVIDKVRNSEYRKASKEQKEIFKGAKYLLLKNTVRRSKERIQLAELLKLNEVN